MIGLDVGGANVKAALWTPGVRLRTASRPLEVWRRPEDLPAIVSRVIADLGAADSEPVACTTTAELCDVFASKRAGVLAVLDAIAGALPGRALRMLRTDGALVEIEAARADPLPCAAANWVASATWAARALAEGVLLDCGGTTTDIVPFGGGRILAGGRTDVERLARGELVYTGALRTSLASMLESVELARGVTGVSAETFAIAADAHRLRGTLPAAACAGLPFPDGRGVGETEVRARLARTVCADPEELARGDVERVAAAATEAQVRRIVTGLRRVVGEKPRPVLAVGVGAFLAREVAARCACPLQVPPADDPLAGPGGDVAPAAALAALAASGFETGTIAPGPDLRGGLSRSSDGGVQGGDERGDGEVGRGRREDWAGTGLTVDEPLVVKLGGGLLAARGTDGLDAGLAEVRRLANGRPVLLVPGGGPFADGVRAADRAAGLPGELAHVLALSAMDQFGELLAARLDGFARREGAHPSSSGPALPVQASLERPSGLVRLSCRAVLAGRAEIPETWSVTSDSLAVYAAAAIGAPQVVLLKPVPGIRTASGAVSASLDAAGLTALQAEGRGDEVDGHLATAVRACGVSVIVRAPETAGTRLTP